ncbi:hypothetical protein [Trichothermofontia sp.]
MKKYFFMQPVLKFVREGRLFSRVFAAALRIFAVLLSISTLIGWIQVWKVVFQMNGAAVLGGLIFQALFVVGVYMVVHTVWIRAADIEAIGKSDFMVIPIVSIFLRMLGEVYACISVAVGVGGGILLLFGAYGGLAYGATHAIPGMGWQDSLLSGLFGSYSTSSFISALLLAVSGAIVAVFWLVLFTSHLSWWWCSLKLLGTHARCATLPNTLPNDPE